MSAKGVAHENAIERLNRILVMELPDRARVRIQSSFVVAEDTQLEPDVAVVLHADRSEHPKAAALIIEVAESSLAYDRSTKARLYAEAKVPEYWIVNLVHKVVEVHRRPARGKYNEIVVFDRDSVLRPRGFRSLKIPVSDLFRVI